MHLAERHVLVGSDVENEIDALEKSLQVVEILDVGEQAAQCRIVEAGLQREQARFGVVEGANLRCLGGNQLTNEFLTNSSGRPRHRHALSLELRHRFLPVDRPRQ